jgi:hypothetical protein
MRANLLVRVTDNAWCFVAAPVFTDAPGLWLRPVSRRPRVWL